MNIKMGHLIDMTTLSILRKAISQFKEWQEKTYPNINTWEIGYEWECDYLCGDFENFYTPFYHAYSRTYSLKH